MPRDAKRGAAYAMTRRQAVHVCNGVARNFRQGVRQSVAFLSVHSRLSLIEKILAHPLGFTRRPITLRNHIPKNYVFS